MQIPSISLQCLLLLLFSPKPLVFKNQQTNIKLLKIHETLLLLLLFLNSSPGKELLRQPLTSPVGADRTFVRIRSDSDVCFVTDCSLTSVTSVSSGGFDHRIRIIDSQKCQMYQNIGVTEKVTGCFSCQSFQQRSSFVEK